MKVEGSIVVVATFDMSSHSCDVDPFVLVLFEWNRVIATSGTVPRQAP